MHFQLVETELSGDKTTIFTVLPEGSDETLFDKFIRENLPDFKTELIEISKTIRTIANITGAREQFFKHNEGFPGDGVCAMFDAPDKKLRLYCIRFGMCVIILGGGGHKPDGMKAFQESAKLTEENKIMRKVSSKIMVRIKEKGIRWVDEDLVGNFNFTDDE